MSDDRDPATAPPGGYEPRTMAEWAAALHPFRSVPPCLRTVFNYDIRPETLGGPPQDEAFRFAARCGYRYVAAAGWVHLLPDPVPPAGAPFFWAKAFLIRYAHLPATLPSE